MWLGLAWVPYLAPFLPSAAAAAVPGEALGARAGPVPRASGVPGDLARPARVAAASRAPQRGGAAAAAAWSAGAAS